SLTARRALEIDRVAPGGHDKISGPGRRAFMPVSRTHLEGLLSDTSLDRVLAACRRHLVTGAIKLFDGKRTARIELRAGVIDRADVGGVVVRAPHDELRRFHGEYEIDQQLPDLTGDLGGSALAEGDV